uniref:Uncharacterized protein n=1 Tax=Arundo donax TaxID=35708 RepID=A0A0A9GIE6_ARUDO
MRWPCVGYLALLTFPSPSRVTAVMTPLKQRYVYSLCFHDYQYLPGYKSNFLAIFYEPCLPALY